jgi:hypothetical protein
MRNQTAGRMDLFDFAKMDALLPSKDTEVSPMFINFSFAPISSPKKKPDPFLQSPFLLLLANLKTRLTT